MATASRSKWGLGTSWAILPEGVRLRASSTAGLAECRAPPLRLDSRIAFTSRATVRPLKSPITAGIFNLKNRITATRNAAPANENPTMPIISQVSALMNSPTLYMHFQWPTLLRQTAASVLPAWPGSYRRWHPPVQSVALPPGIYCACPVLPHHRI